MLKGSNILELAQKIDAAQKEKKDFIADTRTQLEMVNIPTTADKPILVPHIEVKNEGVFPVSPIAHDQIGARLNIPSKYYDRMVTDAPALLATNVNHWFANNPEKRMVRTLGGRNRAFLSNRYQRIENEEIAAVALPILHDLPQCQIVSAEVTERRLYIHFVVPTVQGEVKVGDIVQAGGIISNSEIGLGSVSVSGLIWRLWCLNGAKTQDTFRKNHVGRLIEDNTELWADDTRQADDKAVLLKVRDMVRAVVDETRFRSYLEKLQGLTEGAISPANVNAAVEVLAQKVGITGEETKGVVESLFNAGDFSRWGIVNAVTHQAHKASSYDRAVDFEAAGGMLINLPANDWREILAAA